MTVNAVSDLDLSYTPPLGSPWDAVQIAATYGTLEPRGTSCRPTRAAAPRAAPHPPSHLGVSAAISRRVEAVSGLPMSMPRLASASVLAR